MFFQGMHLDRDPKTNVITAAVIFCDRPVRDCMETGRTQIVTTPDQLDAVASVWQSLRTGSHILRGTKYEQEKLEA